ncbi:MAG TPA: chemotaxis protein CheA [Deltaproteobacteria bacterium]|nr:chemotaxis protein CheA [Deltaproteobacteria bacterium]
MTTDNGGCANGSMTDILDENQELCVDFVVESREMIGEVEPVLVELETEAENSGEIDMSQIDAIFRAFHSMKGSGGFLDLDNLVAVTHQAESLLDLFRKGRAKLEPRHITVLCKAMDFILELLDQIENEYNDAGREEDAQALVAALLAEMEGPGGSGTATTETATAGPADASAAPAGAEKASAGRADSTDSSEVDASLEISGDLIESFVTDAQEQLDAAESALLSLERDPADAELVAVAFRSLHSLKGNCGFFGFADMERIAHGMETLLDASRESGEPPAPDVIAQLLQELDRLRKATQDLADGSATGQADDPGGAAPGISDGTASGATPEATDPASGCPSSGMEGGKQAQPSGPAPADAEPAGTAAARTASAVPTPEAKETAAAGSAASGRDKDKKRKPSAGNIRVDLEKLDSLMDLVGELILAETMVTHNPDLEGHHFEDFQKASLQLNRITRSIQDVAMSVRMVPIAGTFRKMLRLVRDLARKQEKQVELQLVGEETEIDKTVVEAIADPLVHLIRNSVDHGIENPEDRVAAGKSATGRIRLEAKHEGGEIWISIEDDGKGLNRDAILAKAQAKGLIDPSRGELSDAEIYRFIFAAGFSTAEKVTDVSGRGVGMDVVRRNIDELGGRVDIDSQPGQGSTITIRLPLTLAIVEGMLVRVGASVYTIPLLAIRESVTVAAEDVTRLSDEQEMVNIRGRLLPILRIHELHRVEKAETDLTRGILVVVEEHGSTFAIFVDELIGQRQTVIKALPQYLGKIAGVSGCSILSNGDISLILDVKALQGEWLMGADS